SLLNRRLDGSVSGPAQSLYPAWPCSCTGIAHPRQGSLTTNIRVRSRTSFGKRRLQFVSARDQLLAETSMHQGHVSQGLVLYVIALDKSGLKPTGSEYSEE
ncbi:hypothetical protein, partial [Microvirga tunisiensis]|uniref:hypothetical protein n=1 Tax=Microvirga tunisiensis TaxID=2108360 RepID=UPI001AEE606C